MKKLSTLQTRRQTWHNIELYGTAQEATAQGFALMYDDERGTVYGIRSTDPNSPHTFARVAFVPDRGHFDEYDAQAVEVDPVAEYDAHPAHVYHTTRGEFIAVYGCGLVKVLTAKEVADIASGKAPAAATAKAEAERIAYDIRTAADRKKNDDENRETCRRIAKELNEYAAGLVRCPHCERTHYAHDFEETESEESETVYTCPDCGGTVDDPDDLEPLSLSDYLADALDIEYIIDSRGAFKSCRVWIGLGGPNICIDTDRRAVCLYCWGDAAEYPIDCADDVDEIAAEWYEVTI